MSTHEVLVRRITITPHPNAERLELAQVDDYRCVVGKGLYTTGDLIAYVPEQSILPDALAKELELDGKLGTGNRVKPVKLRGELSQGVCVPARPHWVEGMDVKEELGVTKWEPDMAGAPNSIKVTPNNVYSLGVELTVSYDVENAKKWPNVLEDGEPVVVTEKVHGTFVQYILTPTRLVERKPGRWAPGWVYSALGCDQGATSVAHDETGLVYTGYDDAELTELTWTWFCSQPWHFAVSSKGVGAKGNVLKLEDPSNETLAYVRAARELDIKERMLQVFGQNECPVTICGELYGSGVQDLHYGATGGSIGFRVFDIYLGTRTHGRYLWDEELDAACAALRLERVPVLYRGPFSKEKMLELTDGRETISGAAKHIREGVVVCPTVERKDPRLGRVKLKSVSADYLTRKGGTEHN